MRPIRDYHTLSIPDLEEEICEIGSLLQRSMEALATARVKHNCDHLMFYFQSGEDSHAARQRSADYNTQTQLEDVIEFEQQVAAYRVNYEMLTNFITWQRASVLSIMSR